MKTLFALLALVLVLAVPASAQKVVAAQQLRIVSPVTINVDTTGAGTADTLRLTGNSSWYKLRIRGAATDSVSNITGGITGTIYIMQVVASDSQVVFRDTGNLKLGAERILNKTTDRLILQYDGSSWVEIGFYNND